MLGWEVGDTGSRSSSVTSVVPNAQHDPQPPWFFTGVCCAIQDFEAGFAVVVVVGAAAAAEAATAALPREAGASGARPAPTAESSASVASANWLTAAHQVDSPACWACKKGGVCVCECVGYVCVCVCVCVHVLSGRGGVCEGVMERYPAGYDGGSS